MTHKLPFVAPSLTEEASLTEITLVSGTPGIIGRRG